MQRIRQSFKEGKLPFKHGVLTLRKVDKNKQQTFNDSVINVKVL